MLMSPFMRLMLSRDILTVFGPGDVVCLFALLIRSSARLLTAFKYLVFLLILPILSEESGLGLVATTLNRARRSTIIFLASAATSLASVFSSILTNRSGIGSSSGAISV